MEHKMENISEIDEVKSIRSMYITQNNNLIYFAGDSFTQQDDSFYISKIQELQKEALYILNDYISILSPDKMNFLVSLEYLIEKKNDKTATTNQETPTKNLFSNIGITLKNIFSPMEPEKDLDQQKRIINSFYYSYDSANKKLHNKCVIFIKPNLNDIHQSEIQIIQKSKDLTEKEINDIKEEIYNTINRYVLNQYLPLKNKEIKEEINQPEISYNDPQIFGL